MVNNTHTAVIMGGLSLVGILGVGAMMLVLAALISDALGLGGRRSRPQKRPSARAEAPARRPASSAQPIAQAH